MSPSSEKRLFTIVAHKQKRSAVAWTAITQAFPVATKKERSLAMH
jgi:hypothetical protein